MGNVRHKSKTVDEEMTVTVVPAYLRDYKTAEAAAADWLNGKDFVLKDVSSRWHDKPCSVRDFGHDWTIKIRYGTVLNTGFEWPNIVMVKGGKIVGRVDPDHL